MDDDTRRALDAEAHRIVQALASTKEAAAMLGVTAPRVSQMIADGVLTPVPLGGRDNLLLVSEIEVVLEERRAARRLREEKQDAALSRHRTRTQGASK